MWAPSPAGRGPNCGRDAGSGGQAVRAWQAVAGTRVVKPLGSAFLGRETLPSGEETAGGETASDAVCGQIPERERAYYTIDGKLYSMPFNTSNPMVYCNKDAFVRAGLDPARPPRTFADLVEMGRKLTVKDASGRVSQQGISLAIYGWFFEQFIAKFETAIQQLHMAPNNRFTQGALTGVFPQARQTIEGAIESVLAGQATSKAALDRAAREITDAIVDYNLTVGFQGNCLVLHRSRNREGGQPTRACPLSTAVNFAGERLSTGATG